MGQQKELTEEQRFFANTLKEIMNSYEKRKWPSWINTFIQVGFLLIVYIIIIAFQGGSDKQRINKLEEQQRQKVDRIELEHLKQSNNEAHQMIIDQLKAMEVRHQTDICNLATDNRENRQRINNLK